MMLRTGDLNFNQFSDSVKKAVKRTMLQHEIVFKSQVCELHRLYWTQKNLMRELYRKELEAKECRQTVPSQSRLSGSVKEGNVGNSEDVKGKFVNISDRRQRGFNLQLPADDYISNVANVSIGDGLVVGSEIVRPRLSTKEAINEKDGGTGSLLDKGKNLYCYEVIDLEGSAELGSSVEANGISFSGFRIPIEKGGVMGDLQPAIASDMASSSGILNESSFLPVLNHLHAACIERWHGQDTVSSSTRGNEFSAPAFVDLSTDSTHKQQPSSSKLMLIDLNIAQDYESSHALNDPMATFLSPSLSSSIVPNELLFRDRRDQSSICTKETSAVLNSDASHFSTENSTNWLFPGCLDSQRSMASDSSQKQEHEVGNKVQMSDSKGPVEFCRKSMEGFSTGSQDGVPNSTKRSTLSSTGFSEPTKQNGDLLSVKLHSTTHSDIRRQASIVTSSNDTEDDKQSNHESSEQDTVSSHAVGRDEKQQGLENFVTGSKSNGITGSTECSSLEKSIDENSGTTQLDNLVVESSPEKSCNIEQQQYQDHAVVSAAETLACISLAKSSSPVKQLDDAGLIDIETKKDEGDQPQYSSDSFETMTLNLPEFINDEHLILTRQTRKDAGDDASEVNKLRRGRGRVVRDFQKDILPGMVSLSRHEICEDMHSIGYELRKTGSRTVNGRNWFVPVRSKRSRRYSVDHRH